MCNDFLIVNKLIIGSRYTLLLNIYDLFTQGGEWSTSERSGSGRALEGIDLGRSGVDQGGLGRPR